MVGQLDPPILDALLESLPVEFSVIDRNDEVLAWNKHDTRVFKRPRGVLGRNVRNCHPEKSIEMVERIIQEMKAGTRHTARFWIDMTVDPQEGPQKILIEYFALRDDKGTYLGCLEASQNVTEIQGLKGQKRLLDEG
jgi:hypothetical protein